MYCAYHVVDGVVACPDWSALGSNALVMATSRREAAISPPLAPRRTSFHWRRPRHEPLAATDMSEVGDLQISKPRRTSVRSPALLSTPEASFEYNSIASCFQLRHLLTLIGHQRSCSIIVPTIPAALKIAAHSAFPPPGQAAPDPMPSCGATRSPRRRWRAPPLVASYAS